MRPLHPHHALLFLFSFIDIVIAQTLTNVTIDNTDSLITYAGVWNASHVSSRDYGGGHTLSEDPTGSATFTFTGVAVYYIAPKWPYTVNSFVALDGGNAQLVDMSTPPTPQDPPNGEESVPADVLWGVTGLTNTIHRVVVTGGPSGYAVVDGFIYTTQEDVTSSQPVSTVLSTSVVTGRPSASSTRSTGSPSPTSSDSAPSNTTVIIGVTVGATVLSLVLLVGLIVFFVRRRKKSERIHDYLNTSAYGGGGGGGGGAYSIPFNNYKDTTYSAVPLNDVNAYTYPYGGGNNNAGPSTTGQEMGMANMNSRNSRYSAMAYSDGTGSVSMGSLSAQQVAYAGTAPYNQDTYGMYPVANRALVVPNADAGGNAGAYNPGQPSVSYDHGGTAGGYSTTGYDYSGYYPENQPSVYNYNAAAAYASAGPSPSADARPKPSPSPVSEKARYAGMGNQQPSSSSSIREQNSSGGYDALRIAHPYAGTSEPPPYAAQAGPSSSQRTIPASPPNKKKGFI